MSELKLTGIFAGAAVVLAVIAIALAPGRITPEAFMDQGELFYPDFTDPNQATSLEVVEYDANSGAARPFKVEFKSGRWTIPSHHDYPADGKDRLAQTAAGLIDIRKDDFRTNIVADHEACGVIDPVDVDAPGLQGRGSRVTLRGEGGDILADFIVGANVPEREGFRFVRMPDQNRVYASKMDLDISTSFVDWIETELLEVQAANIERIFIDNYSINERTGSMQPGQNIDLRHRDDTWSTRSFSGLDTAKAGRLATALQELTIVGVRPKPEGLSDALRGVGEATMTAVDQRSLQTKGFYLARDDGRLLSNEGDMKVYTTDGVVYTLRFGEVLYGTGLEVTAGSSADGSPSADEGQQANRYLFITGEFNDNYFSEPAKPGSMEFQDKADSLLTDDDRQNKRLYEQHSLWARKVSAGRTTAGRLNARFADWYYVISEESFGKIHLDQSGLK